VKLVLAATQAQRGPEASPLSIFDQALTLSDGSPASPCGAAGLTPGVTPELTERKPRRGSRLGHDAAPAGPPSAASEGQSAAAGVTSPGVAAFLQEQALRDSARRQEAQNAGGGAEADGRRPGLPRAQLAAGKADRASCVAAPQPAAAPLGNVGAAAGIPAAGRATGRQPLQEPAMCLTPPRPQRPPNVPCPEPEAGDVRLSRARAAGLPHPGPSKTSISLDRTSSFSRSSSGSAFSRASSLNDAKVRL